MISLHDACMNQGRILLMGDTSSVLDFIVFSPKDNQATAFFAEWFVADELLLGRHYYFLSEDIIQVAEDRWEFPEMKAKIGAFDNAKQKTIFADMRTQMDTNRPHYLKRLKEVRDIFPPFDFDEWTEMSTRRQTTTTAAVYKERFEGNRQIGFALLTAPNGHIVDYLAIDIHGRAVTQEPKGWLSLFAETWMDFPDETRPDLEAFIQNLDGKSPPMSLNRVSQTQLLSAEGSLLTIASSTANSNLSGVL